MRFCVRRVKRLAGFVGQSLDFVKVFFDIVNILVWACDFRDGFRMIYYPVDCHKAEAETPHLPVAKQLWTPTVGLREGATKWIQAGGGHHTVLSFHIQPQQIRDLVEMLGVTLVEIA